LLYLRRPDPGPEAVVDTMNFLVVATSILTSRLAPTEVIAQPGIPPTLAHVPAHLLALAHAHAPLLVVTVTTAADLGPPSEAAERRRDAPRTMVIATDPIPAMNHHAHVLPEETEANGVLSPAA